MTDNVQAQLNALSARLDSMATASSKDVDHLVEFAALITAILLEEFQMRGAVPPAGQISVIQGAGHLADIGAPLFDRITSRLNEITGQAAQAAAATGDVNSAGKLMLLKRDIEKKFIEQNKVK